METHIYVHDHEKVAAHIFEDQGEGVKFRSVINTHIMDRWPFYSNKIGFPYERQVGVAGKVEKFKEPDEYFKFLKNDPDAALLWSDTEELLAIANLYQIEIRTISTKGPDDKNPTLNILTPHPELQEFCILPAGKVPNMTLLHSNNSHFDLVISRHSRLAQSFLIDEQEATEHIKPNEEKNMISLKILNS